MPCLLRSLRDRGAVLSLDDTGQHVKYRAPKGVLSDPDKAVLLSRREEILRFLRARGTTARPPLLRGSRVAVPSFAQELLWRSARASPTQNGERRIPLLLPVCNRPAAAMQAAIATVVARHEALRYSFDECAGTLQARLNDARTLRVEVERLGKSCSFLGGDVPPAVAAFIAGVPPLEGEWLTRARVFLEPAGEGLIVLIFHHIIADGTSMGVIAEELSSLLGDESGADRSGPSRSLTECAFQFSDFAAWERECFRGEVAERLAVFWADWLATVPPLRLPSTGVALEWARGDRVDYTFDFTAAAAVEFDRLARDLRVTPFLLVLAVFSIALSRWSGQSRYPVLSVADGRLFPDTLALRRTVGPIFHLDPIEISLSAHLQLRDTLRMLETNYAAARELRFPLNDCLPGLRAGEIIHRIGATLNYRDLRPEDPAAVSAVVTSAASDVPSALVRRPEVTVADHYDVPLQPINLRIEQRTTSLACKLEFNDALIPRAHQQAALAAVLQAFEEVLLALRQRAQSQPNQ